MGTYGPVARQVVSLHVIANELSLHQETGAQMEEADLIMTGAAFQRVARLARTFLIPATASVSGPATKDVP